jgi:tellurite resistance protein
MSDEQARRIYELMMLTAWADGCLEASEALVAEAVQGDVPELRQLPGRGALADRAKKRLDQLGLERALAETAAGLADAEHRELAFVCCARILEADGIIAQEEFKLLSQLKTLFGLSAPDVARLLQRAARS